MGSPVLPNSSEIRRRLNHPIIDSDGHCIEILPVFLEHLKEVGGQTMVDRYRRRGDVGMETTNGIDWMHTAEQQRIDAWKTMPPWWALPTGASLDRATAMVPKLLHDRMDELGLDFSILYPTHGLNIPGLVDEELRRACCRAYNNYQAETYAGFQNRMTPAAVIPMHTPTEAVEELDYVVNVLKFKVVMIAGQVRRPIAAVHRQHPGLYEQANRLDTFGIDSEYDYDPVWDKCVELKVAPAAHSGGMGSGSRRSPTNYAYNHIGHFAAAAEGLAKSLFFGGVTRRFRSLKFAFLECGVAWACTLYADLVGHWEKRNGRAIEHLDPSKLDVEMVVSLIHENASERVQAQLDAIKDGLVQPGPRPVVLDDFARCGIQTAEDIRDLFAPHFYFGCEADDPMTPWAFESRANPLGARLRPLLSSDIGHWDVPNMRRVLVEAYELVEKERVTEDQFEEFAFSNAVEIYAGTNGTFFNGTPCESAVEKWMNTHGAEAS